MQSFVARRRFPLLENMFQTVTIAQLTPFAVVFRDKRGNWRASPHTEPSIDKAIVPVWDSTYNKKW